MFWRNRKKWSRRTTSSYTKWKFDGAPAWPSREASTASIPDTNERRSMGSSVVVDVLDGHRRDERRDHLVEAPDRHLDRDPLPRRIGQDRPRDHDVAPQR